MKSTNLIEAPVVEIDNNKEEPKMVIHNYINLKGEMVLSKAQASLLFVQLYNFLYKTK